MLRSWTRSGGRRICIGATLSATALLLAAGPAQARSLLSTTVTASKAAERTCFARQLSSGAGYVTRSVRAPSQGVVEARLGAVRGDWDLAIFDARTGKVVAASTHFGSREVAEDLVAKGRRLVVQACRLAGGAATAHLSVRFQPVHARWTLEKAQLVRVFTPTTAAKGRLESLGLDLTEHGGKGYLAVVLHGAADARALQKAGFLYSVVVKDLAARDRADRRADASYAARVAASALPSGRTTYRHLWEYSNEMKALALANPTLVKTITLPYTTYEGRPVEGIEITTNVGARDGKPVFVQLGVHHAREWPSGEHALEWAYELVNGYKTGNARAASLVTNTRTIVVPIVNPDGFNTSREFGELEGGGSGRTGDETVNIATHPYEFRRKNCRFVNDAPGGSCLQTSVGLEEPGVDPNRNYGAFWGGPGASDMPLDQSYRGPGPFSEPESQDVRWLVSHRQVTALITNHTFSNLVLRPPGVAAQGPSPDETAYKALGDSMAAENGYASLFGYQLYDTTGTTEDWSYWTTGGFGFTFEIGPTNFHPPYATGVVAEYEGTTPAATAIGGHGNREAYYKAQEAAASATKHAVLAGGAPAGAVLRLKKTFQTPTSQRNADGSFKTFTDTLDTTMVVPASRSFDWHVNPSTRPLAAQQRGRAANGPPSPQQAFAGDPAAPGDGATPCADFDTQDPACFNDHPFTVAGLPFDNAKATILVRWTSPASDWDMKVYRDTNGDGSSVGEGAPIAESGRGITNLVDLEMPNYEQAILVEPVLQPGQYVVRMQNYAAVEPYQGTITFEGPEPFHPATTESWTFTCENPEGAVRTSQQVTIARGQRQTFDLRGQCKARS